jgi:small-conductance mechanosensitive channel
MIRLALLWTLFFSLLLAEVNTTQESNGSINKATTQTHVTKELLDDISNEKLHALRKKLLSFNKENKDVDNEWTKTYSAFSERKELVDKEIELSKKIKKLEHLKRLSSEKKEELKDLKSQYKIVVDKLNLLSSFEKDPFKKLIEPPSLDDAPKVNNPISLIGALSYIKDLDIKTSKYDSKGESLNKTISALNKQKNILEQIVAIEPNPIDKQHLEFLNKELKQLYTIKDIFNTTSNVYKKKAEELKLSLKSDIKEELQKIAYVGVVIAVFLVLFIFFKYLTRKYLAEKESFYTVNKVINITFITILILVLLFAYLENVSYLITILGFASAGIAIAMKDWFMSLMGWFVIVIGGTIHVGDRVKFVKDGVEYVGDVVDISMLRITIHEDVTLTTYTTNRRAGRIIFIPNNYVFTDMIANYSHSGLKTVWDGIDFYITFDSNISKATTIAKNIAKQYSKGYTDITRKQLNKLRSKYQLKNTNVEPRVFSFIEGYGMKVSVWYMTNAYATLTLRSTISNKIIEAIANESDIEIAYPTQSFYVDRTIPKPVEKIEEIEADNG